jgi:hypothetical protein
MGGRQGRLRPYSQTLVVHPEEREPMSELCCSPNQKQEWENQAQSRVWE